jgi:enoyl-CoA hydratase/carnithine racemase
MSDDESAVRVTTEDRVGIIELNRPDKFNCLSTALLEGIDGALDAFETSAEVRAVLVCAGGKYFCTGADLEEVTAQRQSRDDVAAFIALGHRVFSRLGQSALPVVAAVQGLCLAGGLELALSCDVVFAAQSARLGDQHARFGLVPGWGGSQRLARCIGLRRALDLMLSARWVGADEARDWGLVNHVAPDQELRQAALGYCRDLAAKSAAGLALMKRLAREGLDQSLDEGLSLEQAAVVDALLGADAEEGLSAFKERREPDFE